jgi:hypothetical protein
LVAYETFWVLQREHEDLLRPLVVSFLSFVSPVVGMHGEPAQCHRRDNRQRTYRHLMFHSQHWNGLLIL